jgi:hypothetical protein
VIYSLVLCLLASFVPLWPMTEFPKPGQQHIGRKTEELWLMGNPTDAYLDNEGHYCQDSLWFFWGEAINVAFDSRMTDSEYLRENTYLLVGLGGGAFLFFTIFYCFMVVIKRPIVRNEK